MRYSYAKSPTAGYAIYAQGRTEPIADGIASPELAQSLASLMNKNDPPMKVTPKRGGGL